MALNEHEERILQEIEQRFYAQDPESAHRLRSTTLRAYVARNCRWAGAGFIAGLLVLVASFASDWVVGVFGFLLMLVSAVALVQNLRRLGRHGLAELRATGGSKTLGELAEEAARRLRRRLGGEE